MEKQVLQLRVPRENEIGPEAAQSLFASLLALPNPGWLKKLLTGKLAAPISFEILVKDQTIIFQTCAHNQLITYLQSQLLAQYPNLTFQPTKPDLNLPKSASLANLTLSHSYFYPLKTYQEFQDIDPLSSILSILSKAKKDELYLVQLIVKPTSKNWQASAQAYLEKGIPNPDGSVRARPDKTVIDAKISQSGLAVCLRLVAPNSSSLTQLGNSFAAFARGDGNKFKLIKATALTKKKLSLAINKRQFCRPSQILNLEELATLWHLPTQSIKLPNIAWAPKIITEPPEDLPVVTGADETTKKKIAVFGQTNFKNQLVKFGIHHPDRRRHIYIIGKTGTGKSTTIANMAIDDMKKGRGLAVIDPHGDLCDILLDYIPKNRLNDFCYFNPADTQRPVRLNPLEVTNKAQAELVASGIISIFHKLYHYSWGPRLEHILRSSLLTLVNVPNSTLLDVPKLLTDKKFREKTVAQVGDKVLTQFWTHEFDQMGDRLRAEAISPILNKVGQFVTSPLIRRILEKPTSTLNLEDVMNNGKILFANLSQGKLGEDNAALLGAMLITKLQLAAMSRVDTAEEQRRDFYLYVDEFRNFATTSFIKILSEARKYRLNLMLANQYMGQLDIDVQKAIFGNAGTLISFLVGSQDAQILFKEFGETITEKDLLNLTQFQVMTRLCIDNLSNQPFLANTLPLPANKNQNRNKAIRSSRERFGK